MHQTQSLPRESLPRDLPKRKAIVVSLMILIIGAASPLAFIALQDPAFMLTFQRQDMLILWDEIAYLIPFGFVGMISWSVWLLRFTMSRFYKPLVNDFRATTSVIVPSYREDPDMTARCLDTWLRDGPNEVIIVVDVDDTEVIEKLEEYKHDTRVRVIPYKHNGKRSALGVGIRAARYEILILTDSDTSWEPGLLHAVQMPFIDPEVGGVGTRQNAFIRESSVWRVVADWLVNTRYLDYVPVEGMVGAVACLSGRTAAYRREAIVPVVEELEYEYFLGRQCVAGDDGRLTWLVLRQGYKTVYQSSARAWSMFPNQLRAFIKQRIRWSRNSYRCYIRAMYEGWLWQQPFLMQIRVLQILATPITTMFVVIYFAFLAMHGHALLLSIAVVWFIVGRGVRSISHLREHPGDIWLVPLVTVVVFTVALPIKVWAFISMNKQGWLTRSANSRGGEGQTEASLYVFPDAVAMDTSGIATATVGGDVAAMGNISEREAEEQRQVV